MRFARPTGGFRITLEAPARECVETACAESADFNRYWGDICDRLRFVAPDEGVPLPRIGNGFRLWVSASEEDRGLPRVKLVYVILGDAVRIRKAAIEWGNITRISF